MKHELPPLPYATDALEPFLSQKTVELHHGEHHRGYVATVNKLVDGTRFASMSLRSIIRSAAPGALFNAAAQAWNHDFYWRCLTPDAQEGPSGPLLAAIEASFGSMKRFRETFESQAKGLFGSGWVWLTREHDGSLAIVPLKDAGNPLVMGKEPLLTCDVWEHAYYLDHTNDRGSYLQSFWSLLNWDFVAERLRETAAQATQNA